MKRHELLNKHLEGDYRAVLERREARFAKRTADTDKSQQRTREADLDLHVNYAVMQHLGYGPIEDLDARLHRGVDRAMEYFLGDWWRANPDDQIYMDKSREDRALIWLSPYIHSMFLCGITQRWDDLTRISEWVDENIEPEFTAGQVEDEYAYFFLLVASKFRDAPLATEPQLAEAIRTGRSARAKLLLSAFEMALARDQRGFDEAPTKSVDRFLKHDAEDVPNCNFWVVIPESAIWCIAERNGLAFPGSTTRIDAAVVRRQTLEPDGSGAAPEPS